MSVNAHNDIQSRYFSGQGVVLIGQRDANGNAGALLPLGNCTMLKITITNSVIDHKNAQDGQRGIDKRLVTETKMAIMFDLENLESRNLATGLRGTSSSIPAGSVSSLADVGYVGGVSNLQYVNVNSLVVTSVANGWSGAAAAPLTEYVNDQTPWDYKWNADAGSFKMNGGSEVAAPVKNAISLTGTPVGTITAGSLAITGITAFQAAITGMPTIAVGDTISLWGVTGAGAASVNGVAGVVTAVSATTLTLTIPGAAGAVTLSTSTLAVPIKQGATALPFPFGVTVSYNYSTQNVVDTFSTAPQEVFLRFEGLNTSEANGLNFQPMIIDVFRMSVDPMKELNMIGDVFGKITIEGALLGDSTKTSGSKWFQMRRLG
jgi:hypothetical protein